FSSHHHLHSYFFSFFFFFSSRRRHTRFSRDWSSDVCSSDLKKHTPPPRPVLRTGSAEPAGFPMEHPAPAENAAHPCAAPLWGLEIGRASCRGRGSKSE